MLRNSVLFLIATLMLPACGDDESIENDDGKPKNVEKIVARGQYLVDHVLVCSDCHTPRDEMGAPIQERYMAGAECFVPLPNGHCLHSRNLTNHETGLKNRTDREIKRMFQDGIRPTASGDQPLHPIMPYYMFHNLTDADADAIVAYLRTIPGVEHEVPRSDEEFTVLEASKPTDVSKVPMPIDDYTDQAAAMRGRYLAAEAGVCIECHTPRAADPASSVLDTEAFFAGGEEFPLGPDLVAIAKNITSDEETGIGTWSVEEIVTALQKGTDKEGDGICPPMPVGPMSAYAGLTDKDATDIAHYIKSLPPISNEIEDMCTWPPI